MVNFAFGIHNHQPLDNLGNVIEANFQQAYRPFLTTLQESAAVKVNFHVSGSLLEWLQENHPDYIADLKELIGAGRVEVLTSGLYEPILTLLPEADLIGQISAYTERLTRIFGVKPRGLWLTERVWEQSLVRPLAQAGVEYVVVDDTHFRNVGVPESELAGYYVTEDQGWTLAVFPISKRLRYLVPFRDVSETLRLLNEQGQYHGTRLATLFDDGEKFGSWPNTQEHVYQNGWLRRFFRELGSSPDVAFTLFSDFLDHNPGLGRVYLDNAAYEEMGEWAMTPDRFRQYEKVKDRLKDDPRNAGFLRTGYFRNFLVKYPEANRLHKRMLFVSGKIRSSRKSDDKRAPARTELYKGQANDAYWHGIFGGLYLPHLRQGAYRHLIRADRLLAENKGLHLADFDGCGKNEIIYDYKEVLLAISPSLGGALLEFDDKDCEINWLDTMTRRPESYHARLRKRDPRLAAVNLPASPPTADPRPLIPDARPPASIHEQAQTADQGIERYLIYDPEPRYSLIDHFYELGTVVQDCYQSVARRLHNVELLPRNYELERHKVIMSLSDFLAEKPSHIYRELTLEPKRALLTSDVHVNFWQPCRYALDLNLLPLKELKIGDQAVAPDTIGEAEKVTELQAIHESGARLVLRSLNVPFGVWYYPIETVSSSERGAERIHQGNCITLHWALHKPAGVFELEISWSRG
jgi:alpha-amylase